MTLLKLQAAGIKSNAGMIVVYRNNYDGTVSEVLRTFTVSAVLRFLRGKPEARYSVSQRDEKAGPK